MDRDAVGRRVGLEAVGQREFQRGVGLNPARRPVTVVGGEIALDQHLHRKVEQRRLRELIDDRWGSEPIEDGRPRKSIERTGGDLLERLDVNGFVYSRGYSNETVAKLQNYILMVIWSIQSDVTAAASYQDFIKHTILFPHETPFSWLLKGNLFEEIIERWVEVRRYDNSIVTVIELLRPEHRGRRRRDYLARRETWVSRDIHLIELNFLLDGRPPGRDLPAGHFSAVISRGGCGCEPRRCSRRSAFAHGTWWR